MAQVEVMAPANVVKRNILLVKEIMRHLLNNPQVFSSLPDKFELVILPEDDPEMRLYNLDLLDKYGSGDKPIVFARVKIREANIEIQDRPRLYAPIPIAV
jgi:hypothetical protein